jgi:hypothetical protein
VLGVVQVMWPGWVWVRCQRGACLARCWVRQSAPPWPGESIKTLAADLNTGGITTTDGRTWTRLGLRLVPVSARISGRCDYCLTDSYHGTKPLTGEPADPARRRNPDRIQPNWIV